MVSRTTALFFSIDGIVAIIAMIATIYLVVREWREGRLFAKPFLMKDILTRRVIVREAVPVSTAGTNKHEERCREIFQNIFRRPFPSCRPSFLKNPSTGRNLELDGFCPSIVSRTHPGGIAFEYDGIQHAKYSPHFHRNGPSDFLAQVKRDRYKTSVCARRGILLIRIPHFVPFGRLEEYIRDRIRRSTPLPSTKSSPSWAPPPSWAVPQTSTQPLPPSWTPPSFSVMMAGGMRPADGR